MESQVEASLDSFFNDDKVWKQVVKEVAKGTKFHLSSGDAELVGVGGDCLFRVVVPKPYPGVQYRRSKNLTDRYERYAEKDSTVRGRVERGGEWLRISRDVFLPMRVGTVQILEPLPPRKPCKGPQEEQGPSFWACCQGGSPERQES